MKTDDGDRPPKTLTKQQVRKLVFRAKAGLRAGRTDRRPEEPGLSERSRHSVYR